MATEFEVNRCILNDMFLNKNIAKKCYILIKTKVLTRLGALKLRLCPLATRKGSTVTHFVFVAIL